MKTIITALCSIVLIISCTTVEYESSENESLNNLNIITTTESSDIITKPVNTSAITNNGIIILEDEIRILNRNTGEEEIAFFWNYIIDYDKNELSITFQENDEFDFSWMTTLVCAYVVPWTRGEDTGFFVRNSTKRRGTNPGTDNFNVTFTHDFKDTEISGFSFTRLMLQPRYDYKDQTIITNPWSSNWTFTDQSVVYSDDAYHMILGSKTDESVLGSKFSSD